MKHKIFYESWEPVVSVMNYYHNYDVIARFIIRMKPHPELIPSSEVNVGILYVVKDETNEV